MPDSPISEQTVPDLAEFRFALPDRLLRHALGIQLSDADARLLLEHHDWSETYYRQWCGEFAIPDPAAPVALPRTITLAPALPAPEALAPAAVAPAARPWWRGGRPVRTGIAAALVGSVLAAALVIVVFPQRTADAAPTSSTAADPFPAGLDAHATAAPTTASGVSEDPKDRLGDDVSNALKLDDRTAAAPAVSGIVQKEVARIADVACLSGYDDATAQRIAEAVSGRSDLGPEAGNAVADAIARYCAATTG